MQFDELFSVFRSPCFLSLYPPRRERKVRHGEGQSECTRIAQELHHTVLHGFSEASVQLQTALDLIPANSPAKLSLGRVLALMERVLEDVRRSVGGDCSSDRESQDLAEAFSRIPQELGIELRADFRVIVLGTPRGLDPGIREETYRIGREALVNAFRHSQARRVEAVLEYGAKRFTLRVRDNGCGIDPQILRDGRDGHWGLAGMRERADKIRANLRVRSRAGRGTEVELSILSRIALMQRAG